VNETPIVNLKVIEPSPTYLKIGLEDGSKYVELMHNPEAVKHSHSASMKALPVLSTALPQQRYQASDHTLEFSNCRLQTPGDRYDLSPMLDLLATWTKPDPKILQPPRLKVVWGGQSYKPVWLSELTTEVTATRQGLPTRAMVSFKVVLLPAPVPVVLQERLKLSEREREDNMKALKEYLSANPQAANGYGLTADSDLDLSEDGIVTVKENGVTRTVGRLGDIIPVRPGINP
jgi:hypothetical protein